MIGGNLAIELGDGEATNQDPAQKNIAGKSCSKFLWEFITFLVKFHVSGSIINFAIDW